MTGRHFAADVDPASALSANPSAEALAAMTARAEQAEAQVIEATETALLEFSRLQDELAAERKLRIEAEGSLTAIAEANEGAPVASIMNWLFAFARRLGGGSR